MNQFRVGDLVSFVSNQSVGVHRYLVHSQHGETVSLIGKCGNFSAKNLTLVLRFEPGDTVRVVSATVEYGVDEKKKLIGMLFQVKEVKPNYALARHYEQPVQLHGTSFSWSPEELELVERWRLQVGDKVFPHHIKESQCTVLEFDVKTPLLHKMQIVTQVLNDGDACRLHGTGNVLWFKNEVSFHAPSSFPIKVGDLVNCDGCVERVACITVTFCDRNGAYVKERKVDVSTIFPLTEDDAVKYEAKQAEAIQANIDDKARTEAKKAELLANVEKTTSASKAAVERFVQFENELVAKKKN